MKLGHCSRENEVATALKNGYWPEGCDPELRDHVASCNNCSDTVMIKAAFRGALAASRSEAHLDTPGIIWWRAQLRRRHAALERVGKPVTFAHLFALTLCIVAALGFAAIQVRDAGGWLSLLDRFTDAVAAHSDTASSFASTVQDWNMMLLLPCVAAIALLGSVVVYLASDRS